MSLFPDLTPIVNKLTEFSQTQSQNQQQMITLLKQIHFELTEIKQTLNKNYAKH